MEFWYRQSIIFYVKEDWLSNVPKLALERSSGTPLSLVHPELFLEEKGQELVNLKGWVAELQAEETRLWVLIDEREDRIAEKEQYIRDLEDFRPGIVPLRKVLRSLPALVKHSLRTRPLRRSRRP